MTLVSNVFIPAIKANRHFCERAIVELGITCIVFLIRGWVGEGFCQQFMPVSPVPLGGFYLSLPAYGILHMPNCSFFVTCKFNLLVICVLQLLWECL